MQMSSRSKKRILLIAASIAALAISFLSCTDFLLHRAIRNYKGEGTIKYLPGFGILGRSGVAIEMPHRDLSKGLVAHYDLTNIPKASAPYTIYLVAQTSLFLTPTCTYTIEVVRNGAVADTYSSPPLKMWNSRIGGSPDHHYYMGGQEISPRLFDEHWAININYSGIPVTTPVEGYILVESMHGK